MVQVKEGGDQVKDHNLSERPLDDVSGLGVSAGVSHDLVLDQDKEVQNRDVIVEDPLDIVVGLNVDLGRSV